MVGVILNLAMFFAHHVLWPQGFEGRFDLMSALIAAGAAVALFRFKVGVMTLLTGSALVGLAVSWLFPCWAEGYRSSIFCDGELKMFMMSRRVLTRLLVSFFAVQTMWASAVEVRFEPVADGVYAYVGDIGGRTVANQGLNANLGLVLTSGGAVLIDSGSTFQTARAIHEAVRRVTQQPVRWVINTGGQDHRWLGNGYFKAQGAELIAHAAAVPDMRSRGGDQFAALRTLLGPAADGTELSFPSRLLQGPEARLELGGTVFEFRHRGGGHTPGDLMVWLPHVQVAFSGDIVYVDRLLSVLPVSSTRAWVEALNALAQWNPKRIVPGHGRITDSKTAKAQSHDYLQAMRSHMQRAVEQGVDISEAVKSFNVKPFMNLANAAELHPETPAAPTLRSSVSNVVAVVEHSSKLHFTS